MPTLNPASAADALTSPADVDIAICGAGPVGMALAAMLVQRGLAPQRLALIDARTLDQAAADPRSLALSYGSRQLLEQVGAWPLAATEIHQIHVSRRGRPGRSLIERSEHGVPALGYVSRYGDLVTVLGAACQRSGIIPLRPVRVGGADSAADTGAVLLQLEQDGVARTLTAGIVVQAEGGLFGAQPQGAGQQRRQRRVQRDYGQTALIAHVQVSAPQPQRAYERFTDQGPLALLPQDDALAGGYALVWCVSPETAQRLLALDEAAFLAQLAQAFGSRLGRFTASSARVAYPLGLNAGPDDAAPRLVAIGNAAQTLHPVAGQGLNLGLRDAAVLARLLAQDTSPAALAAFRQQRRADRGLTVGLTDTMARAFTGAGPLQALLAGSLGLIDLVGPARGLLAELMMYGRR